MISFWKDGTLTNTLIDVFSSSRRGGLDFRGSGLSDLLIDLQGLSDVSLEIFFAEDYAESSGIFDSLTSSLALVGHHLMMVNWSSEGVCLRVQGLVRKQTYRMRCVSHDARHALLPPAVRLVDPQAPRSHFITELEMPKDIAIEIRVWGNELFYGSLRIPCLVFEIACLSWEKAVIRKQTTSVTGRKDDLVMSVVATPVLYGTVLGVIDKSKFHRLLSVNVGVEASACSRFSVGFDAKDNADGRPNAVGADYHVMYNFLTVFKRDLTVHDIDFHRLHLCKLLRV